MATTDIFGQGHLESTTRSTNATLATTDSGVIQNCTASVVLTLPASAAGNAGVTFPIRVGEEGITVEIAPNSADKIVGAGLTAADDKSIYFTNQPAGSMVILASNAAATTDSAWVIQAVRGTDTRES